MDASDNFMHNGKFRQFVAAIIVNLMTISYGIGVGWSSPVIPQLRSNQPPVGDKPMSEDQIPWISSLLPIGGLLAIPFCGILSELIGRKNFALITGSPFIICWLLIIFGQNHVCILIARFFIGISGAMVFFIVPIYVSEIASEDIRGFLGSLLMFSYNTGILFVYIGGAVFSYQLIAILSLLIAMIFLISFLFIPETPVYLVRRSLQLRAHKSLMFFRGNDKAVVEQEITKLRSFVATSESSSGKIKLSGFFRDQATRKGLYICFGLLAAQQLSGIFAMVSYAESIFKRAGSSLSAETASIIIAVIQIVGSCTSTSLIERAGRRLLSLISCFGMTLSHLIVSLFFYLQQNQHDVSSISWLPLVGVSTYIATYCLGIGPVPFVVISEVFRSDVSSFASTMCFVFYFIIGFTAIRAFDLVMLYSGAGGCFLMLAIFSAAGFVFCYWFLLETKGRKREDIVDELAGFNYNSRRERNNLADERNGSTALM